MNTLLILGIYLVGVILCYGRFLGRLYEIDEQWITSQPPLKEDFLFYVLLLSSWLSFFTMVGIYFGDKDKYFFKWNKKELWKKWNNR